MAYATNTCVSLISLFFAAERVSPAAGATTSVPRTREEADERYEWWHFLL